MDFWLSFERIFLGGCSGFFGWCFERILKLGFWDFLVGVLSGFWKWIF